MRGLQKWVWAAILAAVAAAPATAQQGGINSGGQPPGGIGLGGGSSIGGLTSSGLAGGLNTNNFSGGSGVGAGGLSGLGSGSSGIGGNMNGQQQQQQVGTNGITKPTGQATGALQKSNFLAGYYGNPYYQGNNPTNANVLPGGFGNATYPTTGGTGGAGGNTYGTGGRIGGSGLTGINSSSFGGRGGGLGGIGGQNSTNQSGILIPIQSQMSYAAEMRFPTPPVAPTRLQTDLRSAIDGTSMIANSKTIEIITDVKNNVVLRGTVADADEARLVEGMVRLTPGVGYIQNNLTYPLRK